MRSAVTWSLVLVAAACSNAGSPESAGVGEAPEFGHPDSVLTWSMDQKRAGFPRYDQIFPTRRVVASAGAILPSGDDPRVAGLDAAAFLRETHSVGLIVVHGGRVLLEAYGEGHGPEVPWVSYSVAKSVVSMLVGAAIAEGAIESVEDPVTDYVPALRGSAYEGVRIRDVLTMSSGVQWNEDYDDPESDVSQEIHYGEIERLRFLGDRARVAESGSLFNYSTGETFLAGAIVRGAVGGSLTDYLERRIWQPFGMGADATWMLVEPAGAEYAGCCISATLRDYARIGLVALADGVAPDGTRVLPEGWMAESTSPSATNEGYGYLWWLEEDGSFSARGIFGQLIHVDPELDLVVAVQGLWPTPVSEELSGERASFLRALKDALEVPSPVP
jgi:CubicO group peptidase (beta-lactamase class C family)